MSMYRTIDVTPEIISDCTVDATISDSKVNADANFLTEIKTYTFTTSDYEHLNNKPSIESVALVGDKTFSDLGLSAIDADDLIEILS